MCREYRRGAESCRVRMEKLVEPGCEGPQGPMSNSPPTHAVLLRRKVRGHNLAEGALQRWKEDPKAGAASNRRPQAAR